MTVRDIEDRIVIKRRFHREDKHFPENYYQEEMKIRPRETDRRLEGKRERGKGKREIEKQTQRRNKKTNRDMRRWEEERGRRNPAPKEMKRNVQTVK